MCRKKWPREGSGTARALAHLDLHRQAVLLTDAGAVEALPQAMSQHREVAAVQKNSAAALWNLAAGCGGLEQGLADAGAVQAPLEAIAQHGGVAAV